jgi:hypothetical protein
MKPSTDPPSILFFNTSQIYQLSVLCNPKDLKESDQWWDTMRGKTKSYIAAYCETSTEVADYVPARLIGKMQPDPYPLDQEQLKAIATHLSTREYTDKDWQAGSITRVDESTLKNIRFTAWRAYYSDSNAGGPEV